MKKRFPEIYAPFPLAYANPNKAHTSNISKLLDNHGSYMFMIDIFTNKQPFRFADVYKTFAVDFLTAVHFASASLRYEQEINNKAAIDNKMKK